MAVMVEVNEIPDPQIRHEAESIVREWVGRRSQSENWKVRIYTSFGGRTYSEVIVEGPSQKRQKSFFDDIEALPEAIRRWLRLYPLKPHVDRSPMV
jgi:hypothetical protein